MGSFEQSSNRFPAQPTPKSRHSERSGEATQSKNPCISLMPSQNPPERITSPCVHSIEPQNLSPEIERGFRLGPLGLPALPEGTALEGAEKNSRLA